MKILPGTKENKLQNDFEFFLKTFKNEYYPSVKTFLRKGQALSNYIHQIKRKLSLIIPDNCDCFFNDKIIPKTIEFLRKNWNNDYYK